MKIHKNFTNFTLEIRPLGENQYTACLLEDQHGNGKSRFSLPFTRQEFETWKLEEELSVGLSRDPAQSSGPLRGLKEHAVGECLFNALFQGSLSERYHVAKSHLGNNDGLRIRLKITTDEAMRAFGELPWEMMANPVQPVPLALDPRHSVVRYVEHNAPPKLLPLPHPLRVLLVLSCPDDLHQWDREGLRRQLTEGSANIQFDQLVEPSVQAMRAHLLEKPCHALVFVGHGGLKGDEWVICFERPDGSSQRIGGRQLAKHLAGVNDLRLVVLVGCETATARTGGSDAFVGVAHALCGFNLPGVIAMQMPISVKAAGQWSRAFFNRLGKGDALDEALDEARLSLEVDHGLAWMTPVLFLRSKNAAIFQKPGQRVVHVNAFNELSLPKINALQQEGCEVLDLVRYFRKRDDGERSREPVDADGWTRILAEFHHLRTGLDEDCPVHFVGKAGLSLWFALGYLFRRASRFQIGFRQFNEATRKVEVWHSGGCRDGVEPRIQREEGDGTSRNLVISISISADTRPQVRRYLQDEGLTFRKWVDFSPPKARGRQAVTNALDGQSMAKKIAEEIQGVAGSGYYETMHVFLCCPSAIALLTSWHLCSVGCLQVYDYLNPGYLPAFKLGR